MSASPAPKVFLWVFAVFFLLIGGTMLCAVEEGGELTSDAELADDAPYQSEVFEEIGAAIAIVVDTSGSMSGTAPGDGRSKAEVAREALRQMLAATDAFSAKRPDFTIKVAVFGFASTVFKVLPIQRYERDTVARAIDALPGPGGGTAIGEAMLEARRELYRGGVFRKYILVVTDGENTSGRDPEMVARRIYEKSEKVVGIHFVAFDTDPATFGFLRQVGGAVVAAGDAAQLSSALKEIYEGKILAEAVDYGETTLAPAQAGGRQP